MLNMHDSIDLKLLSSFLAVVKHGSVTAAADYIMLSQPAVSRQVAELERRLNVRLFDRAPTSLRLTAAGHQFVPLAQDLVERAEDLHRTAKRLASGEATQFRIVCPEATVRGVVSPFVAATGSPIVNTTLDIASRVYPHVHNREADFAINTLPPPVGLSSEFVGTVPLWAYFSSGHQLEALSQVTAQDLIGAPLIVLSPGTGLRHTIDEALWPVRDGVNIVAEPVSSDLALALAAAGRGVCLDLLPLAFQLDRRPFVHADGSRVTMPLYVAWEAEHFASDEIREIAKTLGIWIRDHHDR